jgi:hypothetical protein
LENNMPDENQNGKATIREVFELLQDFEGRVHNKIDRAVKEINDNVRRVEKKFDTMEAGRLSLLEKEFERVRYQSDINRYILFSFVGALVLWVLYNVILK